MRGFAAGAVGLCLAVCALAFAPGTAVAQVALGATPPIFQSVDANGMDVVARQFHTSIPGVSVGSPGAGGLAYAPQQVTSGGVRTNFDGTIAISGSVYTVSMGYQSESFTLSGGVYSPNQATGSTLTYNSGTFLYTYTLRDGQVAVFDKVKAVGTAQEAFITSLSSPSGEVDTFYYTGALECAPSGCSTTPLWRLQSVANNFGYQVKLRHAVDGTNVPVSDWPDWFKVTGAVALNMAVDACDPYAYNCIVTQTWPSVTYSPDVYGPTSATDVLSRTTTYSTSGSIFTATSPAGVAVSVTSPSPGVTQVTHGSNSWNYAFAVSGDTRTTTVTDPLGHTRVVTSSVSTSLVSADQNGVGKVIHYLYDGNGRVTRITLPEGGYTQYAYDGRGNVTSTTKVAKAGSGLSNIVTSASYDTTCVYLPKCNKPNSVTDARGAQTDITYDTTHGGVLTVTAPAPATGAVRPQTRYTYSSLYAWYKNSGGTIVQAPTPVYRLTSTSACQTTSSCAGGADEVKTTVVYGSTGVANNLLPTSVSSGSGNGSLTATTATVYDGVGNVYTVDGPLPGGTDLTRFRFDDDRELLGAVGPDPDAGGGLKNRAVRTTYNPDGQPTSVEQGTVNGYSDADWAAFAALNQQTSVYDSVGRLTTATRVSSSATQEVVQYGYDAASRLQCTAQRMNSATFTSLPDACSLSTPTGSDGPDRITKNTYTAADQLSVVTTAYLTGVQIDEVTTTYTDDGLPATVKDGNNNLSTYVYDGFDRVSKLRYPLAAGGGSSTTDYEGYTYDAASNVTADRRRDGSSITMSYDNLNRMSHMGGTGVSDRDFAYDNLSRLTSAHDTGAPGVDYAYDALSRVTTETAYSRVLAYQWDLAGRRTRLTWPDALYVTYDYDVLGEMTAVHENGGAANLAAFAMTTSAGAPAARGARARARCRPPTAMTPRCACRRWRWT